ncbi:MAG: hypothetical protein NTU61_03215 [Candidatus Altiarchaeota archaeon]|nr:hypothetical protein [Candidatus Altiarchaeota archaeon]
MRALAFLIIAVIFCGCIGSNAGTTAKTDVTTTTQATLKDYEKTIKDFGEWLGRCDTIQDEGVRDWCLDEFHGAFSNLTLCNQTMAQGDGESCSKELKKLKDMYVTVRSNLGNDSLKESNSAPMPGGKMEYT